MFFRFIYVNYNAWQYAGCDTLWAGIVTALAEKIEQEFGVFTTRVFRSLSLDVIERSVFKSVQYLLIEINENNSTVDMKKEFPTAKKLTTFLPENYCNKIDGIDNKKNCWVANFDTEKEVKEKYKIWQNRENIKVFILKTSDCLFEKEENCENKRGFCGHFRKFWKAGYVLLVLGIAVVFLTSVSLFTYDLYRDFKNNSTKLVSVRNIYG